MERRKRRAVADRHDRRAGKALLQQLVERCLGRLVERGGGLVEEQIVRRMQDRARDADALLLAEREHPVPVRFLVEPLGERREADGDEQFAQCAPGRRCRRPPDRRRRRRASRSADKAAAARSSPWRLPAPKPCHCRTARCRRSPGTASTCPSPTGPVTSTWSRGANAMPSAATSGLPSGNATSRSSSRICGVGAATTAIAGVAVPSARARSIEASKPASRSITARHSANWR